MYSGTLEPDFLQGDVLKGVRICYWSGLTQDAEAPGLHTGATWAARWKDRSMTVVLVSHSCDVSFKNADKRQRVFVTPLQPVGAKMKVDVERELGSMDALSRSPAPGRKDYLNLFYYAPKEGLSTVSLLADFSILYAVDRPTLKLEMKTHQLDEAHREAFRLKVGYNFARPEDDDLRSPSPPPPPPGAIAPSERGPR